MQVRRSNNLVECIMDSNDLKRYDIDISEIRDSSAKDKVGDKLQQILEDINEELNENDKLTFDVPMSVEMFVGNADSILIRIHIPQIENEDNSFMERKKSFDKDERKDLAFSFKSLDDCITFAKQINTLSLFLIEKAKELSEDDLIKTKEEDLTIPTDIPDFMIEHFKKLRKSVVEKINEVMEKSFEYSKNFDGFKTALYKMNGIYYFICRETSYNEMNGVPEEFYLNDISNEPYPAYIEEHGEVIIKEKAAETLAMI